MNVFKKVVIEGVPFQLKDVFLQKDGNTGIRMLIGAAEVFAYVSRGKVVVSGLEREGLSRFLPLVLSARADAAGRFGGE
jgi:hypothetical protein